jgi:hypothetical protein
LLSPFLKQLNCVIYRHVFPRACLAVFPLANARPAPARGMRSFGEPVRVPMHLLFGAMGQVCFDDVIV